MTTIDPSACSRHEGVALGNALDTREPPTPAAPQYEGIQSLRKKRARRGGPVLCSVPIDLEMVTPVFGGSNQTRTIDEVDVIRPATVRGHLRFWWRALYGHRYGTSSELFAAESALWGRAATENQGGRAAVDLRVTMAGNLGATDDSDIDLVQTPGAYALWPARSERKTNTPPAPRRTAGTRFRLELCFPTDREEELRNVLRAWLIFGGYGGRTRRGLGSFTVRSDAEAWLPRDAKREAFLVTFGMDVFAAAASTPQETPMLAGAALYVGGAGSNAERAWSNALDWLKDFRQGTSGPAGDRAREPGAGGRPSISNWPEADKVRHLSTALHGLPWAHRPRHNTTPAWPRAGFGLPIIGQFQPQSRTPRPGWRKGDRDPKNLRWHELAPSTTEPQGFELRWHDGAKERDRLASPLIVKALPLADGRFVPCALWLNRKHPHGEVVLRGTTGSGAPFDPPLAPGDTAQFGALTGQSTLKDAFLDWLAHRATQVAR